MLCSSTRAVAAYSLCKGVAKVHMTQAKHSGDWGRRKQQDNTPKHRRHKKVTSREGVIANNTSFLVLLSEYRFLGNYSLILWGPFAKVDCNNMSNLRRNLQNSLEAISLKMHGKSLAAFASKHELSK